MFEVVRMALLAFVLLISQTTWLPRIAVFGVIPDLFVGFVFYITLRRGASWGLWTAFFLGLLIDVEDPQRLGLHSLAYCVVVLAVDRWLRNFDRTSPIVLFVLFFVVTLISELIRTIWFVSGAPLPFITGLFRWGIPSAIYTVLCVSLVSWFVSKVLGWKSWVLHAS